MTHTGDRKKILLTTSIVHLYAHIIINYSDVIVLDSDVIMKSCFAFSPVGWLLMVGSLALTVAKETDNHVYYNAHKRCIMHIAYVHRP